MTFRRIALALAALSALHFWRAQAQETFYFDASLSWIAPDGNFVGSFGSCSGSFTIDPATPLAFMVEDGRARYSTGSIAIAAQGLHFFADTAPQLQIMNDWVPTPNPGRFDMFFLSCFNYSDDGQSFTLLQFNMQDGTSTQLTSTDIPSVDKIVSMANQSGEVFIRFFTDGVESNRLSGYVTSFSTVPESGHVALLFGACGLAFGLRRCRRLSARPRP